ncbi:hypothetical protein PPL_12379 [Heterostelium album PN500]|uniref:Uncharacterized protein n=1 Tax=Heterostelium pallidum (strain ATCC 26659 / Pp 5 / PN500) TaxID=670386 RepID=D3BMF9_HETP5|nr:hypothetical protein PPL_12379 [Heterostelium album PN500]EFA77171.1 hypothetical protein PPL_12379 [Heterostelium album PN500]|eukprot:XP_020429300.1 hypothetical protein PPL_12379 [Heterostelium album PN500]
MTEASRCSVPNSVEVMKIEDFLPNKPPLTIPKSVRTIYLSTMSNAIHLPKTVINIIKKSDRGWIGCKIRKLDQSHYIIFGETKDDKFVASIYKESMDLNLIFKTNK